MIWLNAPGWRLKDCVTSSSENELQTGRIIGCHITNPLDLERLNMKQNKIPKTDLNVSEICLGTMTFGSPIGKKKAIHLIDKAIDLGVSFIDTANMYEGYARVPGSAGGVAEVFIGDALKGRRDQVVLATKIGMCVGSAPEDKGTSPAAIRKHLELSLKRLNTDYIDIYYLHSPDPDTPIIEVLGELDRVIHQGKVRFYGISNFSVEQLNNLLTTADENKLPRPVICQPALSMLKQDALDDLLPVCAQQHIAVAPYQVLQGGLLTGKYRRGDLLPENSRKAEKGEWMWELTEHIYSKLEGIEMLAQKENISMTKYAIRWILAQPAVVTAVLGVTRLEQLEEAVLVSL